MVTPLISVHVAKAGGTALGRALQQVYGSTLRTEYHDNPADPISQRNIDPTAYFGRDELLPEGVTAIHGHFHPGKFRRAEHIAYSTVLRHPVDNIISIYWFWRSIKTGSDALHDYSVHKNLSVIQTASLPLLRYLFTRTYFGDFDMGRFDVIGRHEDREAFGRKLSAVIGHDIDVADRFNVTPASDEREEMEADVVLRRKLTDLLIDDIRFYEVHAR